MGVIARFAAAAVLVVLAGRPVVAGEYKLLAIEGAIVKWGAPVLGAGATVTYGFVERRRHDENARNCRDLRPIDGFVGSLGIPADRIAAEARAAFDMWEAVADIRFVSAAAGDSPDILIGMQGRPRGRAFADVAPLNRPSVSEALDRPRTFTAPRPSTAVTTPADVATIRRSLICLNPSQLWKIGYDGDTEVYDLRYTFAHEIGHAIGLDHPGPSGQMMSFRYEESFRTPQAGDIKGVVRLYGPAGPGLPVTRVRGTPVGQR